MSESARGEPGADYDLVVLGAGAAVMTAALVGSLEGLRTLLVERAARRHDRALLGHRLDPGQSAPAAPRRRR